MDPIPPVLAEGEEEFFAAGYHRVDVPGAKHFVHRDRPEEVSTALLAWLAAADELVSGEGAPAPAA